MVLDLFNNASPRAESFLAYQKKYYDPQIMPSFYSNCKIMRIFYGLLTAQMCFYCGWTLAQMNLQPPTLASWLWFPIAKTSLASINYYFLLCVILMSVAALFPGTVLMRLLALLSYLMCFYINFLWSGIQADQVLVLFCMFCLAIPWPPAEESMSKYWDPFFWIQKACLIYFLDIAYATMVNRASHWATSGYCVAQLIILCGLLIFSLYKRSPKMSFAMVFLLMIVLDFLFLGESDATILCIVPTLWFWGHEHQMDLLSARSIISRAI